MVTEPCDVTNANGNCIAGYECRPASGRRKFIYIKDWMGGPPSIRIRFPDGEVLEGRTENDARLPFDAGIWLRPFDSTGNNVLVYVPKSSVVEFHVMGVAIHRAEQPAAAVAGA